MTNPAEELHIRQAPIEFICASCKRKQVLEPDQLVTSDAPNKRPKLEAPNDDDSLACLQIASTDERDKVEAKQDPNDDDSLACLQIASTGESDKDMDDRDDQPLHDSAEDELQRLQKEWTSPIYAFFKPSPAIRCVDSRRLHIFECLAESCKAKGKNPRFVNRYLDKADARSTSNLRRHAKICWGANVVAAADKIRDCDAIRAVIRKTELKNGSLSAALEGMGKGKLTYILSLSEKNTESG